MLRITIGIGIHIIARTIGTTIIGIATLHTIGTTTTTGTIIIGTTTIMATMTVGLTQYLQTVL